MFYCFLIGLLFSRPRPSDPELKMNLRLSPIDCLVGKRYMCVMESFTIYASLLKKERKQLLFMKHISKKPHQFSQKDISNSCSTHLSGSKNLIFKDAQFFICVFMHIRIWSTCFFSENVYRHVGKAIACLLLLLKEKQTCDLELFILIELYVGWVSLTF